MPQPGGHIAAELQFGGTPRGIRIPNRQIRSPPLIIRLVPCGPPVLLTSQNLVLSVRLVPCGPPDALSYSVKNSVNDGHLGGDAPDSSAVLRPLMVGGANVRVRVGWD